jgi:ATP-binding cassette subfamily C protein LapB
MNVSAFSLLASAVSARRSIIRDALWATFIINLLALASSLFAMQVYDRVIPNSGFQTLHVLTAGVVLAIFLELLLRHVRGTLLDREGSRIDAELSDWFFARALGIRMEARPQSLGTFAAQIKGLETVRGVMSSGPIFILVDVPFALFFILVIALIGGWLVIVPLVVLPISLLAGLVFRKKIERATAASQGLANMKAGALVESVDAIESIKANAAESTLQRRWHDISDQATTEDDRVKHWSALSANLAQTVQQLGYTALIAVGAYLAAEGHLTMGGLIACSIIGSRALAPMARLPSVLVQWAQAKAALSGLDKLIQCRNELDEAAQQLSPESLDGALRLENVVFSYSTHARPALDLSTIAQLSFAAGERIGVVGAIGSGKSTLLKVASGLWRPSQGRVFLGGVDMAMLSPKTLRSKITYVPQEVRLIRGTLRDNLVLGLPDPGDEALLLACRETALLDLVNAHSLGLALPITEGGRGISGGQRQLIALTRLLLVKPAILLLDEPTSSMDAATESRVVALLDKIANDGTTVIVATHKTAVMPVLTRLIAFKDGKIVVDAPREQALARLAGKPMPAAKNS